MTGSQIDSKVELLARTLAMLSEMVERYDLFADQMLDERLMASINDAMVKMKIPTKAINHPDLPYAGIICAAICGAYRYEKLAEQGSLAITS